MVEHSAINIKQRDKAIDIMKGLSMFAVIAGHSAVPKLVYDFVYLWHIPLFFIVSGYFFKKKTIKELLLSTWKGLIVPYLVTSIIILLVTFVTDCCFETHELVNRFVGQLAINGLLTNPCLYGRFLYNSGPIWFLLALAWCRIIYMFLNCIVYNKLMLFSFVILISFLGYLYGKDHFLPFYLSQSFVSLIFYHIGTLIKKYHYLIYKVRNALMLIGILSCFVGLLCKIHLDIWCIWFTCWPINIILATIITLSIYISTNELKQKYYSLFFVNYLSKCGRFSMLLLTIHSIEKTFDISNNLLQNVPIIYDNHFTCRLFLIILQFSFCIFGLNILERIKPIKYIFNIK